MRTRPGLLLLGLLGEEELGAGLEPWLDAGLGAYLLPGSLLRVPETLRATVAAIRDGLAARGLGHCLVGLGGWERASFEPPSLPELPTPLAIGALPDGRARTAALTAGRYLGARLAALGIDFAAAPLLDLATDPKRPGGVLGLFGEEPLRVGLLGAAYAKGLLAGGVLPCAGRFPGCGTLFAEARQAPSQIPFPAERMRSFEMRAFARGAKGALAAVSVARVLVPSLDPDRLPCARSARVIEGRLRSELGFRGLVIGEALEEDPLGPGRAAVLGALAGCDLQALRGLPALREAIAGLEASLSSGELPAPRAFVAARRLEGLVERARTRRERRARAEAAAPSLVARRARAARKAEGLLAAHAASGLTLYRDRGAFPLPEGALEVFLFAPLEGGPDAAALGPCLEAIRAELPRAALRVLPAEPGPAEFEALLAAGEGKREGAALVFTLDAHFRPGQEGYVHVLEDSYSSLSVVALRDPYDGAFFPRARAVAATFGLHPGAVRAACRLAARGGTPKGSSPVSLRGFEI